MAISTSTAERARDIAQEVATYRPDYNEQHAIGIYDFKDSQTSNIRDYNRAVGSMIFSALEHSHAVIKQAECYIPPRGRRSVLTRQTLAMTAFAGTSALPELDKVLDDCCFGAELKFIHGAEYHDRGTRPAPGHATALILNDAQGDPFAYQKAVGYPYAYVWRTGTMRTHAGLRALPAGSIVRPIYDRNSRGELPPHEKFAGAGLIRIANLVPDEVEFKRFSLEFTPKRIRRAALLDASEPDAYGDYRYHVDAVTAMNSTVFARYIARLLRKAKNYRMK